MAEQKGLLPKEIVDLLNYRVSQEEASSRLYYAMHEWLELQGYTGAACMLEEWADEEMEHAGWARKLLEDYNYLPDVALIPAPSFEASSLMDVMKASLKHEAEITEQCNDLAMKVSDIGAFHVMPLALKYLDEQADEMDKVYSWVDRLTLAGDDMAAILRIDQEMGSSD